jgi:hypothetical protein
VITPPQQNDSEDKKTGESGGTFRDFWKPTPEPSALPPSSAPYAPESPTKLASEPFPALETAHEPAAPAPRSEPPPGEKALPGSAPRYPSLPSRPTRRTLPEYLFSTATGSGRFVRSLVRWLAAISGLFALGLLAGYLALYQPTQVELEAAQQKLKQANQAVSQKDQSLQSAQADRTQAQQTLEQAQADLKKAASENDLLMVMVSVSSARVALANKDGATAKTALEQAQLDLAKAQALIESSDKTKFDVLKARLELAAKELVSDPQAAQTDLGKLSADLTDLRQKLFKK